MNSYLVKGRSLSKAETKTLVKLIEGSQVIVTKGSNAQINKLKNAEWKKLTRIFNATIATTPRTPQQLRLKWENLKKNSRKRTARIQMSQFQTDIPEYIPPDDILDRVSNLLAQSTGSRFDDPLNEDTKPEIIGVEDGCDGNDDKSSIQYPDGVTSHSNDSHDHEGPNYADKFIVVECSLPQDEEQTTDKMAKAHKFDTPRQVNKTIISDPQSRKSSVTRNLAIEEYFIAKKQCLEAKMQNVILKNENLKFENEMLKLQNIKLRLEIEKLKS